MAIVAIAVRQETRDQLLAWVKQANESQDKVEASLSDVIDALHLTACEASDSHAEVMDQILTVAAKN